MEQRILITKAKSESIHNTVPHECTASSQYSLQGIALGQFPKPIFARDKAATV